MTYVIIVLAFAILTSLVIHKRMLYRPKPDRGRSRSFWVSFGLYFVPAAIIWAWLIRSATRIAPLPDPWWSLVALIGLGLLIDLLLRNELTALSEIGFNDDRASIDSAHGRAV